jgi:hypothetical protein
MGEQNRRAIEGEGTPGDAAKRRVPRPKPESHKPDPDPDPTRALSAEADERQTIRQAPANAWPGEGSEDDSIG